MMLYEGPTERHLCPITYFLALALADGALKNYSSISDLVAVRPIPGQQAVTFAINPEMSKTPFLRAIENDGTLSSCMIPSYACINNMVKGTGERAGYKQRLSTNCFRRGLGVAINSKLE
jgi:hypothetical protein